MIILLTNDDGIDAEGIQALRHAVRSCLPEAELYTVAPSTCMSLIGHRVTTHAAIPVEQRDPRAWAVHGTPADCVRLALTTLLPAKPDWVLSGINHGGNMGQDIYISGTVAAVREASYHGTPGIACSQYLKRGLPLDWKLAAARLGHVLWGLMAENLRPGEHLNVNLPHPEHTEIEIEAIHTSPEPAPLPVSYQLSEAGYAYSGVYGDRPRQEGSDVHTCFEGRISVSKIAVY